ERCRPGPDRARAPHDLVHGLALGPQAEEEARHEHGRDTAFHHRRHRLVRRLLAQVPAPREVVGRGADRPLVRSVLRHAVLRWFRKLARIRSPDSVRMDSGWNWTPSAGSVAWRIPMTTPSASRALTSSSAGSVDSTRARA